MTTRDWLTTAEAAVVLERTAHTVGYLARTWQLPSKKEGRSLLVSAEAVHERAEQQGLWVSHLRAAVLVGCSATTILRAVQRGQIARRTPVNRAQPALLRASVDAFARQWAAQREAAERHRTERAAKQHGPPDDEHVWLKPQTAALLLGMGTSRLRQLAWDERVPFTESGGRRWYRRDLIEQAAAARVARAHLSPSVQTRSISPS